MNVDELLAAYDEQMRGAPPNPPVGVTIEQDGPIVRMIGGNRGFITAPRDLGVEGAELDALIARQRDYFATRGEAVEWKIRGHDLPADLTDRLVAAGFVPEEVETVLVGETSELTVDPEPADGVTIRQITAPEDLLRVAGVEATVWGGGDWSWLADDLRGRIEAAPDDIYILAAEANGVVVSAAWLVYRKGVDFAGLWGGSTLKEWRGRGIYRALVAKRAQHAAARGVPFLYVDASADSSPILQRLGLRKITTTTPYVWTPPRALTPTS